MAKMSQKSFYEIATKLIQKYGSVVIYYREIDGIYMRRRKIMKSGKSFVSHLGAESGEWSHYYISCFVEGMGRTIPLATTFKEIKSYDRGHLEPLMIEYGRSRRRIER